MDIIPVIDLKGGHVVHARQGRRDDYQPIETPLARSSAPLEIVSGLLGTHPFRRLYVADLDAIGATGEHRGELRAISERHPGIELWVDRGIGTHEAAREWLRVGVGSLVLGSESQTGTDLLRALREEPRVVLSLDFRDEAFQGPAAILEQPALWPVRVIVMTLARVGASQGPDLDRVADALRRRPGGSVYAAGGVRDIADLRALAALGAAGALVATALHAGALTASELRQLDPF